MLETVAELGVPIVMMHMRGTSQTMTSKEHCTYATGDCIAEIATGSCDAPTRYISIDLHRLYQLKQRREEERRGEKICYCPIDLFSMVILNVVQTQSKI
jgi:hypothetical protein